MEMPEIDVSLIFDKPLFSVPRKIELIDELIEEAEIDDDMEGLYNNFTVDKDLLRNNINYFLNSTDKIDLKEVLDKYPMKYGLAELLAYLDLGEKDDIICEINDSEEEQVTWINSNDETIVANIPIVIFHRRVSN